MTAGRLTTHVLDTALGKPAAGMKIMLYKISGQSHRKVLEAVTNADGRCDAPLLAGDKLTAGSYELVFCAGEYLRATGQAGEGGVVPPMKSRSALACRMRGSTTMCRCCCRRSAYSTYRGS